MTKLRLCLSTIFLMLFAVCAIGDAQTCTQLASVTLTGVLQGANGVPATNNILSFRPSQQGYISGCGVNLQTNAYCATSTDGSVVSLPNPTSVSVNTTSGTGSLPSGTYYAKYAWYDAAGHLTLPSPETITVLSSSGALVVNPPATGLPQNAVGMKVYIASSSGAETLQGTTTGINAWVQNVPLVSGTSPSLTNTTICQITANDAIWPSGTGYIASLSDSNGNAVPGYPMEWQLMGPQTTINLSNGLPYYHGVVFYPVPVLTDPQNHGVQSISGPLDLSGYNLTGVARLGIGTETPGWGIDEETSGINTNYGYLYNGAAPSNHVLLGNGSYYIDSATIPASVVGDLYYQQAQSNTTNQPQEPALNFTPRFALTDTSGLRTTVDLQQVGTAGSFTNPSITFDVWGRETAVTNGPSIPVTQIAIVTTGICTTANTAGANCANTVTWPSAFADTNYAVTCSIGVATGSGGSDPAAYFYVGSKSTTQVTVTIQTGQGNSTAATTVPEIDCIGVHP